MGSQVIAACTAHYSIASAVLCLWSPKMMKATQRMKRRKRLPGTNLRLTEDRSWNWTNPRCRIRPIPNYYPAVLSLHSDLSLHLSRSFGREDFVFRSAEIALNPVLVDGINHHLVSQLIVPNHELHRFVDGPVSLFQVVVISQNHNAVFLPFGVRFGNGDLNIADALKGGLRIPSDIQIE